MSLPFAENPLRTRADVERLVVDLANPLLTHFSPGRAHIRVGENRAGFGDPAGWLEGFARPLWGLVPLAAGGGKWKHWSLWQQGLAAGTDPQHPEYWGLPGDFDQRSVEQAAIGLALAMTPKFAWDPLKPQVQKNLSAWLQRINEVKLVRSNWLFFRVLVNLGLRRCGQKWSRENVESDLTQIDEFYLGNGWYSDGLGGAPFRNGRLGDYYVPMALQFYALIYARLYSADDPTRAARYVERARLFAADFIHWFSADGSALPFGRSLTYRFAQGAFWGALPFAGVEALPWGVIKGLYLRHLRWWMQQPIFSENGLLTIGYTYPNLLMAESYNSPGSPYWALKTFLPLALPSDHPFWRAEELPLPPRRAVHTVTGAKLILTTDPGSRDVTALNPGQPVMDWPRNAAHKYSKCTYSTRFGFSVPASTPTPTEGGLDNELSLSDDGRFYRAREHCLDPEACEGVAYSRWEPWPDVVVRTWLVATEAGHLRIHRLQTARKLWTLEAGFAVGFTDWKTLKAKADGTHGPEVRSPRGASLAHNLLGERRPECVSLGANSSLLTSLASMPVLHSTHEPGIHWLASFVSGSSNTSEPFDIATAFSISIENDACRILCQNMPWWSYDGTAACGRSSPERLQAIARLV